MVSREDSYRLVQRNAMPVWRGEGNFLDLLKADADVRKALSDTDLEALFDMGYHTKHVETIFARVIWLNRSKTGFERKHHSPEHRHPVR